MLGLVLELVAAAGLGPLLRMEGAFATLLVTYSLVTPSLLSSLPASSSLLSMSL